MPRVAHDNTARWRVAQPCAGGEGILKAKPENADRKLRQEGKLVTHLSV